MSMYSIIQLRYKSMIVLIVEFLLVLLMEGIFNLIDFSKKKLINYFSIFIRDSTNCVLATVCKQFRTRDCRDIYVYLSCESQPIIESSHNVKFGCLTLNYEKLAGKIKY